MLSKKIQYDKTFPGFLTLVFDYYEKGWVHQEDFVPLFQPEEDLFAEEESYWVETDWKKAERVANGLKKARGYSLKEWHYAFLSEWPMRERILLQAIKDVFTEGGLVVQALQRPHMKQVQEMIKKSGREKHRMEAFVRFQETAEGVFIAEIEPDTDALPLIIPHFKRRFPTMKWFIFDQKRKYGLFYDTETIQELSPLENNQEFLSSSTSAHDMIPTIPTTEMELAEKEVLYQTLWKRYFQKTCIRERLNLKLHLQHQPRRYWKYMTEKK